MSDALNGFIADAQAEADTVITYLRKDKDFTTTGAFVIAEPVIVPRRSGTYHDVDGRMFSEAKDITILTSEFSGTPPSERDAILFGATEHWKVVEMHESTSTWRLVIVRMGRTNVTAGTFRRNRQAIDTTPTTT